MTGYLESTVAQKIRDFLDDLDAAPPPTTSAREIEALLVSRVRARAGDPETRRLLRSLLANLAIVDPARLPAPACETVVPSALADELAALLAPPAPVSLKSKPRPTAALAAAAVLICGALAGGCQNANGKSENSPTYCSDNLTAENFDHRLRNLNKFSAAEIEGIETDLARKKGGDRETTIRRLCTLPEKDVVQFIKENFCTADVGIIHFEELIDSSADLTSTYRIAATRRFSHMRREARIHTIKNLCGKSATEIAAYVRQVVLGIPSIDSDHEPRPRHDGVDSAMRYKGVDF